MAKKILLPLILLLLGQLHLPKRYFKTFITLAAMINSNRVIPWGNHYATCGSTSMVGAGGYDAPNSTL